MTQAPGTLAGLSVVVTGAARPDDPLARALARLGAEVIPVPTLVFEPPADPGPLARAVAEWGEHDWVAFTSPRGVAAVADAIAAGGRNPGACPPRRLAVVGSTTGAAARALGWNPELTPARFDAGGLLEEFDRRGEPAPGARVLLPLAERARDTLRVGLLERGARVTQVVAYRSAAPPDLEEAPLAELLGAARPLLLTFASPSSAQGFAERAGRAAFARPAAVIGPVTAAAARALGYEVVAVADEHTLERLAEAVERWWTTR